MSLILHAIERFSVQTPHATAIEGSALQLSYRALYTEVERLSLYLESLNIHCMALLMDNGPAWIVFDLAAQKAGITLVPIPPFFSPQQREHSLTDAGVEVLISDQSAPIFDLPHKPGVRPLAKVAGQNCWQINLPVTAQNRNFSRIAKITYTSGTTGSPKGVCLQQAVLDNVAVSLSQAIQVTPHDRHLSLLPLAVLLENIGGIYTTLLSGACCLIPSLKKVGMLGAAKLIPQQMSDAIITAHPSSIILLPQMLQILLNTVRSGAALPKQLRFIAVGGAPIAHRLLDDAQTLGLPLFEGYGLSECASVVALNTPAQHRPGSVGKLLPHMQIKFSDEGEILLAGNLFSGYLNQKTQIETEKWYATGDLGHLDSDGYLYLTGRKKSCFITSFGRNVAPEWVERELTGHSAIEQAVLFGEARPYNIAVITTHQENHRVATAIEKANEQLPDYAQVSAWLAADEFFSIANQQLTATGRPRREVLWSLYGERIDQLYRQNETAPKRSQHAIF